MMMSRRFGNTSLAQPAQFLYPQNDLIYQLRYAEEREGHSNVGMQAKYAFSSYWLSTSNRKNPDWALRDGDTEQRDLVLKMTQTLSEYSMRLLSRLLLPTTNTR